MAALTGSAQGVGGWEGRGGWVLGKANFDL